MVCCAKYGTSYHIFPLESVTSNISITLVLFILTDTFAGESESK